MIYCSFTVSHFLSGILRMSDNGRKKFRDFLLFLFSRNSEIPPLDCKINGEKFKKICKGLPILAGQRRKFSFLDSINRQFHHFENTSFWKRQITINIHHVVDVLLHRPSFPIGLVKTESDFIVRSVETGIERWTLMVAVISVNSNPFLAFSNLTCHLKDTGIDIFWLHYAAW